MLAVGCLDGRLRFFTAGGTQKHKDREIEGEWGAGSCASGGIGSGDRVSSQRT